MGAEELLFKSVINISGSVLLLEPCPDAAGQVHVLWRTGRGKYHQGVSWRDYFRSGAQILEQKRF